MDTTMTASVSSNELNNFELLLNIIRESAPSENPPLHAPTLLHSNVLRAIEHIKNSIRYAHKYNSTQLSEYEELSKSNFLNAKEILYEQYRYSTVVQNLNSRTINSIEYSKIKELIYNSDYNFLRE